MILKYDEISKLFCLDYSTKTLVKWISGRHFGKPAGILRYNSLNVYIFQKTIKLNYIIYCLQNKVDVDTDYYDVDNDGNMLVLREKNKRKKYILYRVYENNVLLYVGISSCFEKRVTQHLQKSLWANDGCEFLIKTKSYANRQLLMDAEKNAINKEFPKYNKALVNYIKYLPPSKPHITIIQILYAASVRQIKNMFKFI